MDLRMPGMDGPTATRHLLADPALVATKVVILTTFDLDDEVYGALRAGASGFLVKDTEPEQLIHAVRVVAQGDALLSPSITRRPIAEFAGRAPRVPPSPRLDTLTEREREVLGLVAAGCPTTIMVVVFGAFLLDPSRMLQQFGLGLAVAVLLDAVVIRCLIVPAVMRLLGARAWWLPAGLERRLPRVALEPSLR
jgi:DNA-binding response OmpR family regulator